MCISLDSKYKYRYRQRQSQSRYGISTYELQYIRVARWRHQRKFWTSMCMWERAKHLELDGRADKLSVRFDGVVRRESQRPPVAQSRDADDDFAVVERLVVIIDVVVGLTLHHHNISTMQANKYMNTKYSTFFDDGKGSGNWQLYISFHFISFYSATKDQKASYKSRQNTILYSAHIHTCVYTSHIYTYTNIHMLSQHRCWEHYISLVPAF